MALDSSVPAVLFRAPAGTEEPAESTTGEWHGAGERSLNPFAVEPADRAPAVTTAR
ncbi:hypothetical protein [Actinoplanes sp. DH11]|uniref:hypothetical protein n=1 Tax=Actinoplanes sp. DH11 TaxID=2857011 RepID=UPI001E4CB89F|nr:hypothetical protein [Actinoplanes sp. DH11]